MSYQGVLLYAIDPTSSNNKQIRPVTVNDFSSSGSSSGGATGSTATESKQDSIIAKNEQIRTLLDSIEANQPINTAEITKILDALGYSSTSNLSTAIAQLNQLLTEIRGAIAPPAKPVATFTIAGAGSGTIPEGARYANFTIPLGGAGTIQGTAYTDEMQEISFPELSGGYDAIAFEVTAGSLYITYAV